MNNNNEAQNNNNNNQADNNNNKPVVLMQPRDDEHDHSAHMYSAFACEVVAGSIGFYQGLANPFVEFCYENDPSKQKYFGSYHFGKWASYLGLLSFAFGGFAIANTYDRAKALYQAEDKRLEQKIDVGVQVLSSLGYIATFVCGAAAMPSIMIGTILLNASYNALKAIVHVVDAIRDRKNWLKHLKAAAANLVLGATGYMLFLGVGRLFGKILGPLSHVAKNDLSGLINKLKYVSGPAFSHAKHVFYEVAAIATLGLVGNYATKSMEYNKETIRKISSAATSGYNAACQFFTSPVQTTVNVARAARDAVKEGASYVWNNPGKAALTTIKYAVCVPFEILSAAVGICTRTAALILAVPRVLLSAACSAVGSVLSTACSAVSSLFSSNANQEVIEAAEADDQAVVDAADGAILVNVDEPIDENLIDDEEVEGQEAVHVLPNNNENNQVLNQREGYREALMGAGPRLCMA